MSSDRKATGIIKIVKLEGRIVSFRWDGYEYIGEIVKELENGLYFQYIHCLHQNTKYYDELENEFFKWEEISRFRLVTKSGKLKAVDHPKLNKNINRRETHEEIHRQTEKDPQGN